MNKTQAEILNLLLQDCRISNVTIAKKLQKPRHVVSYNREQLKKQGIITGYKTILDVQVLGFQEAVVYLKIFQYSEIKEKIEDFIINHSNTKYGVEVFPNYNIRINVVFMDLEELEKIVNEIEKLCEGRLLKKEILFFKGFIKKEMYCTKKSIETIKKIEQISLDKKEKKLLQAIFDNPIEKLLDLSKKSGLSIEGARQKIEKFQKSGLIRGFTTKFDKSKIGINFWGQLCLRINNLNKHFNKFRTLLYSDTCYGVTRSMFGSWNVEMGITVSSFQELIGIIKKLEKLYSADFEDFEIINHLRKFLDHKIPEVIFSD